MVLKIRSLAIVSLLVMLFSGVVSVGVDNPNTLNPWTPDFYVNWNYVPYYPDKNHMNYEKPNLFISGIMQKSPNAEYNDKELRDFADENGAIYVPTYYATPAFDALAVNDAAKSKATDANGLTRDELKDKEYGTIIGYSGGTTSVVTAMVNQNVKADTLILISPVMGGSKMPGETFDWDGEFEQKLQTILSRGTKIVIIQSPDDVLPGVSQAQYKIPESIRSMSSWLNDIEVHNVELERSGKDGHIDMFYSYAIKNIKKGEYIEPKPGLPLNVPLLPPDPTSMSSGEGTGVSDMGKPLIGSTTPPPAPTNPPCDGDIGELPCI
jgi:hypothetical protein